MRTISILAALAVLSAFSAASLGQTVPGSMRVSWTLPTTGCTQGVTPCDNVPLGTAGALTGVEVYISTAPIPDNSSMSPTLTLPAGATTGTHTLQVANGATLYARVKARNGATPNSLSPFSVQVSKLVSLPVTPNAPTSVTIELTITG